MNRESDAALLRAVILGRVDPLDPCVATRLIVLRALHHGGDEDTADLLARAFSAQTRAADRAYLTALIDGSGDLLAADTFSRLEPLFPRYEDDPEMRNLVERAALLYGDAAVALAHFVLAQSAMREVIEKAGRAGRDS